MDWCIDRLAELRGEYDAGAAQLAGLDRQRAQVRDQLLRIEGAVRVLEEQLASAAAERAAHRDPARDPARGPEPVPDDRAV